MTTEEIVFVQDSIDYAFKNPELLEQAFTRSSYTKEHGGESNEVLEFIGDKALDFVVVKLLSDQFGKVREADAKNKHLMRYISECDEGELTKRKAELVQKKSLSYCIDVLDFSDMLIMGNGDINADVSNKASAKEDLFEAIVGAVTIDSDWNFPTIENVVEHMLQPILHLDVELETDYIGQIQKWSLKKGGYLPKYHFEPFSEGVIYMQGYYIGSSMPINMGRPQYMCYLKLPDIKTVFVDFGNSYKEARKNVAQTAYGALKRENMLLSIKDEIDNPNFDDSINQLEILSRRGYFDLPTYDFTETHDSDGNPVWDCICRIKAKDRVTNGKSSLKKDAKRKAAFEMLENVLNEK